MNAHAKDLTALVGVAQGHTLDQVWVFCNHGLCKVVEGGEVVVVGPERIVGVVPLALRLSAQKLCLARDKILNVGDHDRGRHVDQGLEGLDRRGRHADVDRANPEVGPEVEIVGLF